MSKVKNDTLGLAWVSESSYTNPNERKNNNDYKNAYKYGYEILQTSGLEADKNGFFAAAFLKENTLVISIRGTDKLKDWRENKRIMDGKIMKGQLDSLKSFVNKIQKDYPSYALLFTGHSKGGALSHVGAAEFNAEAVAFDAPGTKIILEKYYPNFNTDNLTNIVVKSSIVGNSTPHSGNVYEIDIPVNDITLEDLQLSKYLVPFEAYYLSENAPKPRLLGVSRKEESKRIEGSKDRVFEYYMTKATINLILQKHDIVNIVRQLEKNGRRGIESKKLTNFEGGNIYDTISDLVSYSENKEYFDGVVEIIAQHPTFKRYNSSWDEVKTEILNKTFIEGRLNKNIDFIVSSLQDHVHLRAMVVDDYNPNLEKHIPQIQKKLTPIVEKLKSGQDLSFEEYIIGHDLSKRLFNKLSLKSKDNGFKYNYEFVANTGEVGVLTNQTLKKSCALQGKDNKVCDYTKMLLTNNYLEEMQGNPNKTFSSTDHDKMRVKAFADAGITPKGDIRNLVCDLNNGVIKSCDSINDYIQELKPHINFEKTASGIFVASVKAPEKRTPDILASITAIKEAVGEFFAVKETQVTSIPTTPSFLASSKDVVSKVFKVKLEQVKHKYASDINDKNYSSNGATKPFNNIFTIDSKKGQESSSNKSNWIKNPFIGMEISTMRDPEFTTKMIISPIRLDDKATSPIFQQQPADNNKQQPQPDNSKLRVDISDNIYDKHKDMKSHELRKMWKEGVAAYGGHHEVSMPETILNGNGVSNVRPSSIVTNNWRPGAEQKSLFSTDTILQNWASDRALNFKNFLPFNSVYTSYLNINNCRIGSFDELNIDPIVIDLDNSGFKLTSWKDNDVLFDMKGDGYLRQTGWVKGNTGILVLANDNGVNSIFDLVSERLSGSNFEDGFGALSHYDEDQIGFIDSRYSVFNELCVWLNKSGDGVFKNEELKTLQELGIKQINLKIIPDLNSGTKVKGNLIKSVSSILMKDGSNRKIAAVDFMASSSGHIYEKTEYGVKIVSVGDNDKIIENDLFQKIKTESVTRTTSSFFANDNNNGKLNSQQLGVQNIFAGKIGRELVGNQDDNWLVGSPFEANKYKGVTGDNTFIINEYDKEEEIEGGDGFNTVIVSSSKSRYFNPVKSNISVIYGSQNGDVIDYRDGNVNSFIKASSSSNIIYGGNAASVLSGGNMDDVLISGPGGGILRANSGNNYLISDSGNTILESGIGVNYLIGGGGNNIFKCNAKGFVICDGSRGSFNVLQLTDNIYDYAMEYNSDNHIVVRNKNYYHEFSAVLINIHKVDFADMTNFDFNCVLPQKWLVPQKYKELGEIEVLELMKYEFSPPNKKVGFRSVHETKGCTLKDVNDKNLLDMEESELFQLTKFYLTYEKDYTGPVYIKYTPGTISHKVRLKINDNETSVEDNGLSILLLKGTVESVDQYYCDSLRISTLKREECLGQGIKIQVCETNSDHSDGVSHIIRTILPKAKIFFTDKFFTYAHERMDVLNFSITFHSPLNTNMEYHYAIGEMSSILEKRERDILVNAREGKGLAAVFSSGNERACGGDSNYDLIRSMPEVIVVGAVSRKNIIGLGEAAIKPFSNPGANILVSAPGAFMPIETKGVHDNFGNYFKGTHVFSQGTSYAAPLVSTIIAAMLQVNKYLTVNDIKKILACSAKIVTDSSEWNFNSAKTWNGGGMHFSYDFGFGNIDAHNAILLAKNWFVSNRSFNKNTIIFSKGYQEVSKDGKFFTDFSLEEEIISTSINFTIEEVDIFNLGLDIIQDSKTYSVLKPKFVTDLSHPILQYSLFTPLTYCMLGTSIKDKVGINFKNIGNSVKFGFISVQIISIQDENTNYIFTDEYESLYNVERSTLEASNIFNTINLAPVTSVTNVNLNKSSMYLSDKYYILKGIFQNVICSEANSFVVGNEDNNVIIANGLYSEIHLVSGHNIVSSSSMPESTTLIISGECADMFVIKKAANSITIIEKFKQKKFDKTPEAQLYSDIINLGAFSEYKNPRELIIDYDGGGRVINLPDNQKIIIKDVSTIFSNNFRFDKTFNITSQFGEKVNSTDMFINLIFGSNKAEINQNSITELAGYDSVESSIFDNFS